jgi:hypothetical protein
VFELCIGMKGFSFMYVVTINYSANKGVV